MPNPTESRNPDSIISSVILERNYPRNSQKAFLIVEGPSDLKFYRKPGIVNTQKCTIVPVEGGKGKVKEVLDKAEKAGISGILGIRDADYLRLHPSETLLPNLLLTDVHDLESMLLQTLTLENILSEFADETKLSTIGDIRNILLNAALPIGYLRFASEKLGLNLRFDGLKFHRFVNISSLETDVDQLINEVKTISQKSDLENDQFKDWINQVRNETHDPWQICCGHDLVEILARGLRQLFGSEEIAPKKLESQLRTSYQDYYFSQTELYSLIKNWELCNQGYIILSR